jgi:hypothetical protein
MTNQHHSLKVFSSHPAIEAFTSSVLYCFRNMSAQRRWTGIACSGMRMCEHKLHSIQHILAVVPKNARNRLFLVCNDAVTARLALMALASVSKTDSSTSAIVGSDGFVARGRSYACMVVVYRLDEPFCATCLCKHAWRVPLAIIYTFYIQYDYFL